MSRPVAVAATLAAAVLWGTSFAVNDAALRVTDPFSYVAVRFAIAAAALLAVAAAAGRLEPRLATDPRIWLLGALNAAGFLGQAVGQCWTTPARTALFVNANVFLVAALSAWVFRERFGRGKTAAVVAAFAGVALLGVEGAEEGACGPARWFGDAIVFAGALAWAFYYVLNRKWMVEGEAGLLAIVAWTFAATAAIAAPTMLLAPAPPTLAWPEAWPIVYAALVTTVLTYVLWSVGLRGVSATTSAVLVLFEVVVAVAITLALGRESFTVAAAVGGALLLGAIAHASVGGVPEKAG